MDDYLCWWRSNGEKYYYTEDYYYYVYDYYSLWNWRHSVSSILGRLLYLESGPRILSEVLPHYSQCTLMLLIAAERYILICFPTTAKQILNRKRRVIGYVFVTFFLIGLCGAASYHYWRSALDLTYDRNNLFENVGKLAWISANKCTSYLCCNQVIRNNLKQKRFISSSTIMSKYE